VFTISATISEPVKEGREEAFKNLKILPKDISEKSLDSVMGHFSISLGVKCNFCHAPDSAKKHLNFPSDEKEEKNTARDMFRMVSYINTNFFNDQHSDRPDTIHTVVCYTCHRGGHEPDSKVFLALIDSTEKARRANRPPLPPPPPGDKK
jgi:hypothetical protein